MSDFKAERFQVSLLNQDSRIGEEPVTVEVGLDGLKILSRDGTRALRNYAMKYITRWELRGDTLTLYAKTSVDVEERQVTLSGRESRRSTESKKTHSPVAEEVDFWINPEKEGWMWSQGEVIKTWRRRWFVLKSGFLFRFLNNDIDSSSKPRGIVDLSIITDITEGSSVTGKPHSLKLSTATGYVCYCADSETDQVEWISALDTAHAAIVKRVAGVEDCDDRSTQDSRGRRSKTDMVSVVGYDSYAPLAATAPPASNVGSDLALNYGEIEGIAGIRNTPPRPSNPMESLTYDGNPGRIPMPSMYPVPVAPQSYHPPSYNVSILDQAPQQTPAYPSFQSISAPDYHMQVPVSHQNRNAWQAYRAPDGRVYYHNRTTGKSQWERPPEYVV